MKAKTIAVATAVCAMAVATGCISHPGHFLDKSKPMEQGKYEIMGKVVTGESEQWIILGFGVNLPTTPLQAAYEDALRKAPGADALIEMSSDAEELNLYWVQRLTTKVSGRPVKTK